MEFEFEKIFEEFAAYARSQGASDQEIQEMKISLLDAMFGVSIQ